MVRIFLAINLISFPTIKLIVVIKRTLTRIPSCYRVMASFTTLGWVNEPVTFWCRVLTSMKQSRRASIKILVFYALYSFLFVYTERLSYKLLENFLD